MAKSQFAGELVHFGSVRYRVTGSGVLRSTLYSLDEANSSTLPTLNISSTTNREPTILANFIDQMGYLEIKTTAINETFSICKIVVFVRPIASGYPQ